MSVDPTPVSPNESPVVSEAKGIFQSDIIIRTALMMGLRELRAHPYLLDYCFASLLEDDATVKAYGDRERQKAKQWFLRTDIPVVMDYHMTAPEGSMISIALVDSTESETTVADTHYRPTESVESIWPVLAGPFDAASYVASTGEVTLPADVTASLVVVPGMLLLDRAGRQTEVLSTSGDKWAGKFKVAPGLQLDLRGAVIKGAQPALVQAIESLSFKEVYRVGCHAIGEPYVLTWLHSIVVFCLLRYKELMLEGRGFERSVISSSAFAADGRWGTVQNLWTRFVTVSGYVRNSWPKLAASRITGVTSQPTYSRAGELATATMPEPGFADGEEPWSLQDGIGAPITNSDE